MPNNRLLRYSPYPLPPTPLPSFSRYQRLNGTRLRQEESKQAEIDRGGSAGVAGRRAGHGGIISDLSRRGRGLGGGFDVTVEGVAISGPLETTTEIRVAMEHDWHSANIAGERQSSKEREVASLLGSLRSILISIF